MGGGGGGGLLGGIGETLFGDGGAGAAGNAAMAQQRAAQQQYAETSKRINAAEAYSRQAGEQLGAATVSGLASLDRDLQLQEKNISRQEQLISQLDPTIIEASQQALRLLRGESASTLGPLKAQRDQQRQKLLSSLREQLGPGAETSTAGIQALTRFDAETDNLFAGAQQQALSTLGGLSSQFTSQRPDMFREIMGRSSLGQQKYGLGANQAQFTMGQGQFGLQAAGLLNQAANPMLQSAGAEYTADVIRGQQQRKFGESLFKIGAGAAIGGLSGAPDASMVSGMKATSGQ